MPKSIPKQIILITGCSSGFGLETTVHLASKGHHVIATMRNLTKQRTLLDRLGENKENVEILELDVTKNDSINATVPQALSKYEHIDVLVNNAGFGMGGFFEDLSEEEIRRQMETNFFGVQNVTRAVIPSMRLRKKGKIINTSSVSGFSTSPCFGAYNASKWALEGFSESLRYELKLFGISVHLIEPGIYRTNIFHENAQYAKNFDNPQSPYYSQSQSLKSRTIDYVNQCRKNPQDIAKLVEKIITSRNPSFRNFPDIEGRVLYVLRKILPFTIYSRLIEGVLFKGTKS